MWLKIKDVLYTNRSNAYKAALSTSLWVFIGGMIGATTGLFDAVTNWVNGSDPDLYDDLTVFAKAVATAAISAWVGLLNYVVRFGQSKGAIPGNGPTYDD